MVELDYSEVMTNDPQDWGKFLSDPRFENIDKRTRRYLARHRKQNGLDPILKPVGKSLMGHVQGFGFWLAHREG